MLKVGEILKYARENCELTQVKVAELTGISNKTLSGYENDVSYPDLETLVILADLYNVSTDYLLKRTSIPIAPNNSQSYSNSDKIIISALPKCPKTNKEIIISLFVSWGIVKSK